MARARALGWGGNEVQMEGTGAPAQRLEPAGVPRRAVIEDVKPTVDGGRFPAKAAVGDDVVVEATAFVDGHDLLACDLRVQREGQPEWTTTDMAPLGNDRWRGTFHADAVGRYRFSVRAGVDRFATWRRDLVARADAGQDVRSELLVGAALLSKVAARASGAEKLSLSVAADAVATAAARSGLSSPVSRSGLTSPAVPDGLDHSDETTVGAMLQSALLTALVRRHRATSDATTSATYTVVVDPALARFSTWYEMFPRSASPEEGRSGTLADVEARLEYVEALGADVLYLPPVHPIGTTARKGRDGAIEAAADDPGSPWAIGSPEGGHCAIDPSLGTLDDLRRLVSAARERRIEVAMDVAFQCSPDHPWVREHPEWFLHRPDGSIGCAENPPKRYEDIYPLNFENDDWWGLWLALAGVVRFWIAQGVRVFRVDNPHTKPFAFWEWLLSSVKDEHPEVILLSEAFTRPAVMYRLAKLGFTQSYTYFAWRNTKWELESYMAELAGVSHFFRPNFWPNTPDILTDALQTGGTATFVARLVLASTLTASYGVYGPVFELQEHLPRSPGSEEYLGSEKYAVRHWDLDRPDSLAPLMARLNAVRRSHRALQRNDTLRFHATGNDQLIAYSKTWDDDAVLVIVNLDPAHRQSGWVDLGDFGRGPGESIEVHDLLTDARYRWEGSHSFVILDPGTVPAHVLSIGVGSRSSSTGAS
ncbi:MAG TPA: alpha-1,4-glucan--maltose-1-phosphate maltosyltransferase [Acidimicrobiales bacterium]|nr:alpha-1,4-glucan--maltose-1-phosphate maltosyltransferase [Acidimicrobiales bacterium]